MNLCHLIFLAAFAQTPPSWTPAELQTTSYSFQKGFERAATFRRKADSVDIFISVNQSTPSRAVRPIVISAMKVFPRLAPSGLPLGRQFVLINRPGYLQLQSLFQWEDVDLTLASPRMNPNPPAQPYAHRPDDLSREFGLAELLARKSLSGYAARRLAPSTPAIIGGRSLATFVADKSNTRFVDLDEAVSAVGSQVTLAESSFRAEFMYNGVRHVLLLGADRYKKGSSWFMMPDITMLRDGRWLVPSSLFSSN